MRGRARELGALHLTSRSASGRPAYTLTDRKVYTKTMSQGSRHQPSAPIMSVGSRKNIWSGHRKGSPLSLPGVALDQ